MSSHKLPLDASTVNKSGVAKEEQTTAKEMPSSVDSKVVTEDPKKMDRTMSVVLDETQKDHMAPLVSTKMTAENKHLEADIVRELSSDAEDDTANTQDISTSSGTAFATPSTVADADQLSRTDTNAQEDKALPDSAVRAKDHALSASVATAATTPEEDNHEKIKDTIRSEVHDNSTNMLESSLIEPTENFIDASDSAEPSEEQLETEVADGSPVDIEMTESRFYLQHGFEELEDVEHTNTEQVNMTSERSAVGFETMESRFHLQHESDDVVEDTVGTVVECHDSARSELLEQGDKEVQEASVSEHGSTAEAVAIATLTPVATHVDDDASLADSITASEVEAGFEDTSFDAIETVFDNTLKSR
jgi:hypothetical protein